VKLPPFVVIRFVAPPFFSFLDAPFAGVSFSRREQIDFFERSGSLLVLFFGVSWSPGIHFVKSVCRASVPQLQAAVQNSTDTLPLRVFFRTSLTKPSLESLLSPPHRQISNSVLAFGTPLFRTLPWQVYHELHCSSFFSCPSGFFETTSSLSLSFFPFSPRSSSIFLRKSMAFPLKSTIKDGLLCRSVISLSGALPCHFPSEIFFAPL